MSDVPVSDAKPFFIAGIGSSAGGLKASEQFLRHLPPDSGVAFVLVAHLAPEHKSLLPELLQRCTEMPVVPIEDGMQVQPNSLYVVPPNKQLSILHGTLQLLDVMTPYGVQMPIDFFFRHLAADQGDRVIGIVLSGMGTDGSLGIKAIKENFGLTMAQDPQSAKFDGMPRSAIDTGLIDTVLPAEEMAVRLLETIRRSGEPFLHKDTREQKTANALQKICVLLRARTGNDFTLYKSNTVLRRIERRMSIHQLDDIGHYVRHLQQNPQELDLLYKELLIGVTSFFRDPQAFTALQTKAIAGLLQQRAGSDAFRVWVPGCSTGEEAYSLAILLRECLEPLKLTARLKIQIFATDIDETTVEKARQGTYPTNIAADVSPERLQRFFREENSRFQINKEIREMVVFASQNLLLDPPFTRLDLISCRNLLIYLTPETQQKLLTLFHYALNPDGLLFLGSSEMIGDYTDLFAIVDSPARIYRRKTFTAAPGGGAALTSSPILSGAYKAPGVRQYRKAREDSLAEMAQRLLLESFAPPAALVTEQGDILYVSGRTGKYLELPAGKANMNLFAMAREGLRLELGNAVLRAAKQQSDVNVKGVRVRTNGDYQTIDLTIRPIREPEGLRGLLLVVFKNVEAPERPAPKRRSRGAATGPENARIAELEKELKAARENLMSVVEQMETSREETRSVNEEHQSANEELQSTNEELQSTNEELMTSREEMQSLNEELLTVNAELSTKNEELSHTHDDMVEREARLRASQDFAANIIATLRQPFLVLDAEMKIVTANRAFYELFQTTPGETERRLLYSLGSGQWDIPELKRLLEEILPQQTQFRDLRIEHDFPGIGRRVVALNARQIHREPQDPTIPMILLAMEDVTPDLP